MLTLLAALAVAAPPMPDPGLYGVRVSLNGGDYNPGDPVKVEVEPGEDGYLLVLRVDGDGYLRVLFPLDPDLDSYVRGGRRYELRSRSARSAFEADDRGGTGLVFAVLAREPLSFEGYSAGMHWDYERLGLADPAGDIEAQLLGIARQMTGNGRFDYDLAGYRVWGPGFENETVVMDPYSSCLACGWGGGYTGVSVGIGWHGYRDPWYYDPWYDPWYPAYYHRSGWNGWWGWDPYWGTPWRPITVINLPPRPTVPDTPYGTRARPRAPLTAGPAVAGSQGSRPADPGLAGGYSGRARSPLAPAIPAAGSASGRSSSQPASRPAVNTGGRSRAPQVSRPNPAPATRESPPPAPPAREPARPSTTRETSPPPSTNRARPRQPDAPAARQQSNTERPVYRPPTTASERPVQAAPRPAVTTSRPTSAPPMRPAESSRPRQAESRPPQNSSPPAASTNRGSSSGGSTSANTNRSRPRGG